MEIPFDYIVFWGMLSLKKRNQPCIIRKENLFQIIKNVTMKINESTSDVTTLSVMDEFDFELKVQYLLAYEQERLYFSGSYICLCEDIQLDELSEILTKIKEASDEEENILIDRIIFMFDYDISSLELLGIKFRRGLYGDLIDFESSIEKLYNSFEKQSLLNSEMSFFSRKEKIISDIKCFIMMRGIIKFYMNQFLTEAEVSDLFIYSNEQLNYDYSFLHDDDKEKEFIYGEYYPLIMSVFCSKPNLSQYNINYKLSEDIQLLVGGSDLFKANEKAFKNFYMVVLYFLDEEIFNYMRLPLYYDLLCSKYSLMYSLDMLLGTATFLYDGIDISNYKSSEKDYEQIKELIFLFIDDILMYRDDEYPDITEKVGCYYENIIKKVFVKAYYYLTDSEDVIKAIGSNEFYDVNKISTNILRSAVGKRKNIKTRKAP